jgi:hypothetical protein
MSVIAIVPNKHRGHHLTIGTARHQASLLQLTGEWLPQERAVFASGLGRPGGARGGINMKMAGGLALADAPRSGLGRTPGGAALLSPPVTAPRNRGELMRQLGLTEAIFGPSLVMEAGRHGVLTSDLREVSTLTPTVLRTSSVEEFKSWLGWGDRELLEWPGEPVRWELPSQPWSGRPVRSSADLTPAERADVEKAGWIYLFGDSRQVCDYRQLIELCHAPFELAVYAAPRLELLPGATLNVKDAPALLLFDEVVLHPGAQLATFTICRAMLGRLEKLEATGQHGSGPRG